MASDPVTPPSKQNGNGLQDPFTDEKKGEHRNSGGDEGMDEKGDEDQEQGGEKHKEETPTLFYAYARRSDNHWSSRYLLTFSSAQICNEWWSLVQSEYPDQGTRHGPQFFSFVGDDFPKKPATSSKFEHLKTKWFYSQFGDASTTGGRTQEIIPLQDWDGRIIRGGSGVEDAAQQKTPKMQKTKDKGKGKAIEEEEEGNGDVDDEEDENGRQRRRRGDADDSDRFDFSGLASSLQSAASIAETTNAQVSQLAESQFRDQEAIHEQQERLQRMTALVEENAAQLQTLGKSHVKAQQQNRELAEQNARILRELKRQRAQAQSLFERGLLGAGAAAPGGGAQAGEAGGRDKEQGEIEGLHVVVHPPPRKIDRVMVGYAYQLGDVGEQQQVAKKNPVKRPAAGGRTTSAVTGTKGAGGK